MSTHFVPIFLGTIPRFLTFKNHLYGSNKRPLHGSIGLNDFKKKRNILQFVFDKGKNACQAAANVNSVYSPDDTVN